MHFPLQIHALLFLALVASSLSSCASSHVDEAMHRNHVTVGTTLIGAVAGAALNKNNRVGGAVLGGYGGNILGNLTKRAYVSSKQQKENEELRKRRERLQRQQEQYYEY